MSKIIQTFAIPTLCAILIFSVYAQRMENEEAKEIMTTSTNAMVLSAVTYEPLETVPPVTIEEHIEEEEQVSDEDIKLIALVTMAEAEGECEEGKRLVIDTILNRVDSEHFPDTIHDVIYQPYHFSSMWNGRADRCEVREEICQLVREELESRTNYDVMFFTAGGYSNYGVPMIQLGNHYFSSYY